MEKIKHGQLIDLEILEDAKDGLKIDRISMYR